ncbi:MAG: hypothetical protein WCJ45_05255 [bacterium]
MENLDALIIRFNAYCDQCITDENMVKSMKVDTKIYDTERNNHTLLQIDKLAPFGEGNKEPIFLLENVHIDKIEKVGTR